MLRPYPSILPLYEGMRVLLDEKLCVTYGLMNGCGCIIEQIMFDDNEDLDRLAAIKGPNTLQYVPSMVLLRAKGADWILPPEQLPKLPKHIAREGLFHLRPRETTFTFIITHEFEVRKGVFKDDEVKLHIKRTQFSLIPAFVRTVYAAQGETWEAVVVDMKRPPGMTPEVFWLACFVMLSRATSINGLLVLRLPERQELCCGAPPLLLQEVDRLLALEKQSISQSQKYLEDKGCNLPHKVKDLFRNDNDHVGFTSQNPPLRTHERNCETQQKPHDGANKKKQFESTTTLEIHTTTSKKTNNADTGSAQSQCPRIACWEHVYWMTQQLCCTEIPWRLLGFHSNIHLSTILGWLAHCLLHRKQ